MQTPWGPLRVSDAHVHFFSHRFFSALTEQKAEALAPVLGWQIPAPEPELLAETWAHELDRHGVESAALISSIPGDEDSVAAAVALFPEKFYGYFMVNPTADGAANRVAAALDRGHLRAICLFPAMHHFSMAGGQATAVLDVAAARPGTLVFVHCGALSVGVRKKLGLPSLYDLRYSNPADLHPQALRYSKIRFVIPHFGAGYFRETLMVADLCPNVYLDTSSSNHWMQYQESAADLRTVFRRALDVVGAKRLLFGTDSSFFPRGWHAAIFETQAKALYELGVSAEDAGLIFGENLRQLHAR